MEYFDQEHCKQELKGNANSTTCGVFYQPVVPKDLKKYSKIDNDK